MPNEPSHTRRDHLRVRLLQTDPQLGDVDGNVETLTGLASAAQESDLAVAPELATHGYHLGDVDDADPLELDDPRLRTLGQQGPVVISGFAEGFRHHVFNSAALLAGDAIEVQRKLHLPTYRNWEERKHFRPGGRLFCHNVLGTRLAMLVCNDAWQPPVPWLAAHSGAEVLVVPTNSVRSTLGATNERTWEILLQYTAIVLQCYVVFVNRTGFESGSEFWGGSRVVGPAGDTLDQLDDQPGVLDCELDLAALRRLRRQWPLLQESRADLIAREADRLAAEEL